MAAYNQRFTQAASSWQLLIDRFSGIESTIKNILIDLGPRKDTDEDQYKNWLDVVEQLDSNNEKNDDGTVKVDISDQFVNSLIYAGGVGVIINNGAGVPTLNPAWTCGPAFQYDYTWITAVGVGQDTLLKQYLPNLNNELQKLSTLVQQADRRAIETQDRRNRYAII